MTKLYREDIALEVFKTLLTSDQRELIDVAKSRNMTTAQGMAVASFELSDAFIAEATRKSSKQR